MHKMGRGDKEVQEEDGDMNLYDEDGLLREEKDGHYMDKSKLITSVNKILEIKKKGRGAVRREAVRDSDDFVPVKRKPGVSSFNKLLESVKSAGEEKAVEKVSKLVKSPSVKPVKTLEVPLEKPQALKAKRTVLYDNAKKDVSRFNAIVYHNRVAEQLVFPLNSGKQVAKPSPGDRVNNFIPMTPLEEEMAKVLYGEDFVKQKKAEMEKPRGPTDAEAYALSVEEALNMHSEMARLRAQQSYQMTKAKRQNKIKSKKYHRLLRKEKIRKQLKEFEQLQKTDPETAMLKLEELNKSRIQERMSLKHRNTSKWAKMQAARAKYNKDSRIALSEQLQISKNLTQKVQESSDEEEDLDLEVPQLVKSSLDNPWMLNSEVRDNEKMQLYYCGYKKLWDQINQKKEKEKKQQESQQQEKLDIKSEEIVEKIEENSDQDLNVDLEENMEITDKNIQKVAKKGKKKNRKGKQKNKNEVDVNSFSKKIASIMADKDFTELDLDMLIEEAEDQIKSDATKQLQKISKEEKQIKKALERRQKKMEANHKKKTSKMVEGDADEIRELKINPEQQLFENGNESDITTFTTKNTPVPTITAPKMKKQVEIDPNNYLTITKKSDRKKKFDGDNINFDAFDKNESDESDDSDDDVEGNQRKLIAEAFEDDDVIEDFQKRKQDEIEGSKPKDIDLSLPGWGEWGGKGIVINPAKKKKFTIKAAPAKPRKDAKLSHVILNEEAGEKLKEHLVRELPFPFKRVKEFEKTIRAPVGRTWMPEKAMKDLTAPKIITRLGTLIEPLDETVLTKNQKGQSNDLKVPLSIKRLAKVKK